MFDFTIFLTDTYAIVLAAVMLAMTVLLCLYYGLFHFRIGRWHRKEASGEAKSTEHLPPVSVVLTARNDAEWLRENLVYLLEQDYPNFEVVVVDYLSHDDTQFVLKLLKDYYPVADGLPEKPLNVELLSYPNHTAPTNKGYIRQSICRSLLSSILSCLQH